MERARSGGLRWSEPRALWSGRELQLCEPGAVRSPDGRELSLLLRENARKALSQRIVSRDDGANWSAPTPLPAALTGDRHTARTTADGRLVVVFRAMPLDAGDPFKGDFVAWIGRYEQLRGDALDAAASRDATPASAAPLLVRLLDNQDSWDCGYPGLEFLPDGTFVATTYGHWVKGEAPFIVSVRFTLAELDARAAQR
ncbi:MAG: exo-alpha-sialidase [Planctomycetes bacterium]|nr:exo-alpha-sialidase [Planctomycetota bacterium]